MTNLMDRRDVLGGASLVAAAVLGTETHAQPAWGHVTVHILDLSGGKPASGVPVDLYRNEGGQLIKVTSARTDTDGRTAEPLIAGKAFSAGRYLITVDLSDYFKRADKTLPDKFFRKVSIEFEVTEPNVAHHIPVQCTPWTQYCSVLPNG